jgi:cyanophycinase
MTRRPLLQQRIAAAFAPPALVLAAVQCSAQPRPSVAPVGPTPAPAASVGPARGALVLAGGGRLGADIMDRFVALAGGVGAHIVVIPTAGEGDTFAADRGGIEQFRALGVREVTVLHTRDPAVADRADFVEPLRRATGVWMPGGRQWRLADAYLDTRTLHELFALLDRGGVIGGTSAGASIQPSYMVRGAVEGNHIMMAPGHERGFGLLRDVAVDQHLLARNRQDDMLEVVARHPHLLGIGIDEGTALIVQRDLAEVVGRGRVAFYNTRDADGSAYYFLEAGGVFDLARRVVRAGTRIAARGPDERAALETVQRLFDAMRAADTAAIRDLFHPDARYFAIRSGQSEVRGRTVAEFNAMVAAADAELDERFDAARAEVRIDGPLAAVWTYYDFIRGGTYSHCGIDAFHLHRGAGASWRIIALSYTTRTEGCVRPAGVPGGR